MKTTNSIITNLFFAFMRVRGEKGSALLFAVVTAFVIAFIGGSMVLLTSNQYRMIDLEIKRKEAYNWLRAGMEYANYQLRNGLVMFDGNGKATLGLPDKSEVKINIFSPGELSDYKIEISTSY